jgi:hypothetical protein
MKNYELNFSIAWTEQTYRFKIMADLEAVLQDITYLVAMEQSRKQPAARSKKILLPDARFKNVLIINY